MKIQDKVPDIISGGSFGIEGSVISLTTYYFRHIRNIDIIQMDSNIK